MRASVHVQSKTLFCRIRALWKDQLFILNVDAVIDAFVVTIVKIVKDLVRDYG